MVLTSYISDRKGQNGFSYIMIPITKAATRPLELSPWDIKGRYEMSVQDVSKVIGVTKNEVLSL